MKFHRLRLLTASIALLAFLFGNVACASSRSRSRSRTDTVEFSAVQTGSYIPRVRSKPQTTRASNAKVAKAKRPKRAAKAAESKPAKPADDDYVTRGGFR